MDACEAAMKYLWAIWLSFISVSGFSQSGSQAIPELVQVFPSGNGANRLGIQTMGGDDTPGNSVGIFFSGDASYILDSVNYRFLATSIGFGTIDAKQHNSIDIPERNFLSRLWVDNKYMILGYNRVGPDSLKNTTVFFRQQKEIPSLLLKPGEQLANWEMYSYLCHMGDILYFQSTAGTFFGFDLAQEKKGESSRLLNEAELRVLFGNSHDARYTWDNDFFMDHSQLLSGSSGSALGYFSSLPKFDKEKFQFVQDMDFYALPNGLYSFISTREIYVFNKDGELLRRLVMPRTDFTNALFPSTPLSIAPDGCAYYFHADFEKMETRLYRIGPFPQLMLGYGGISGTVNSDHVNVREKPDTKSLVMTQISKATPARILDKTVRPETIGYQTAVWYQVRLWDRTEGWVFGAFIDIK